MTFHLRPQSLPKGKPLSISGHRLAPRSLPMAALKRTVLIATIGSLGLLHLSGALPVDAKEKIRIGTVENVVLLPWGVELPARIDTGAATSSLDARNLTIKGQMAEFNLPQRYGGAANQTADLEVENHQKRRIQKQAARRDRGAVYR